MRIVTMGRRDDFPEPPWVYGPSEVNKWIDSKYPSKKSRSYLSKELKARADSEVNTLRLLKEVIRLLKKLEYHELEDDFDGLATELLGGSLKFKAKAKGTKTCKVSIVKEKKKGDFIIELHFHPAINLRGMDRHLSRFKKKAALKNIKW